MTYTKNMEESLNFMECIQLLETMIGYDILTIDPQNPDNLLMYRNSDGVNPEGWYSENLLSVASELVSDIEGQRFLREELNTLGVSLEFNDVSGNHNHFPPPIRY